MSAQEAPFSFMDSALGRRTEAVFSGQAAEAPPGGTWQVRAYLTALQNAQSLGHSCDMREP